MSEIKVSIIITIYNNEKYLKKGIQSLLNQTLKNIELICINDGSTDQSLNILKALAVNDKRIVIINKKNTGYGDSLNVGLSNASGEYIGFMDSDDFVDATMFEKLYTKAMAGNYDIVKARYYNYQEKNHLQELSWENIHISSQYSSRLLNLSECPYLLFMAPSMWSAIYKKTLLDSYDIKFLANPGAAYQDTSFSFKVFAVAKRVYLLDEALLFYRQDNMNSSVKDISDYKIYVLDTENDEIIDYLKRNKLNDRLYAESVCAKYISVYWTISRIPVKMILDYVNNERAKYPDILCRLYKPSLQYLSVRQRLIMKFISVHCMLGIYIYRFLKKIRRN